MDRVSHFWLMKELSIGMCVCVGGESVWSTCGVFWKKE